MFNLAKYDFSQESKLKQRLFKEVKKEYDKFRRQISLSDDDLDLVVAAGNDTVAKLCPLADQTCDGCDKFKSNTCTAGYTKGVV